MKILEIFQFQLSYKKSGQHYYWAYSFLALADVLYRQKVSKKAFFSAVAGAERSAHSSTTRVEKRTLEHHINDNWDENTEKAAIITTETLIIPKNTQMSNFI